MPILNPNSTNYVHASEPNTSDLHMAMEYDGSGQLFASYEHSGQAKTSTWTGKVFYNSATNGF